MNIRMIGLFALAAAVLCGPAVTAGNRPLIVTSQDHSLGDVDDCKHFHTQNQTSFPSQATAESERDVPLSGIDLLRVRARYEGGVSIRGWDRPTAKLTVCKFAVALTDVQAKRALGEVSVSLANGEILANGPEVNETQAWWVHMILRVPQRANLDVASVNGGIAIRNMSSKITARATNGGISVAHCSGDQKLWTENGGISLERIAGMTEAATENGPISLRLRSDDNSVPPLEAKTAEEGAIVCNLRGCADGIGNWNSSRTHLRIGSASPRIRLSTNGAAPIMIEQVR